VKIEIVTFTGDSGLADYAISLAQAAAKNAQVTVVTAISLPSRFDLMGFKVKRVFRRSRHYPIDMVKFFIGVVRRRADWILVQGPFKFPLLDGVVIRTLGLLGIGTAVVVHDLLPHYPRLWSNAEYGFYYRSFKRVVVHSEAALLGVKALGIKVDVLVVPHGVYDIFKVTGISREQARLKIGQLGSSDFVVLFFGNLEPRKGLIPFLNAAQKMGARSDIKFLIAGRSCLDGHAAEYAAHLEATRSLPNVLVHDKRIAFEEVESYFSACDVVALPYLEGTTSGVLKLALAFEKPVIATKVGDFPEQVPAGAGLFIENDSTISSALCTAITTIESNQASFTSAMATAGRNAQWPDIAARLMQYLKSKQ
jgi:glycosyltransferase involved in cell wall biosynthesis